MHFLLIAFSSISMNPKNTKRSCGFYSFALNKKGRMMSSTETWNSCFCKSDHLPHRFIIYSQPIRSSVPMIVMMDDSSSATTGRGAAMYHSAGCTIEQTKQRDWMARGSAKGILFAGGVDSHCLELCKMQLVNIAPIVDMCVCNLTEKDSASIGECKKNFPLQCLYFSHGQIMH